MIRNFSFLDFSFLVFVSTLLLSAAVAAPAPRPHVDRQTQRPHAVDSTTGLSADELSCLSTRQSGTSLELTQHYRASRHSLHRLFPSGKKLAHLVDRGHLEIQDLERGTTDDIELPADDDTPTEVVIAPNGKRLYLQYDAKVVEVDLATKRTRELVTKRPRGGLDAYTSDVQLSSDGSRMLTTGDSPFAFSINLWNLQTGKALALALPENAQAVPADAKFAPDGKSIFARHDGFFLRWDAPFKKPPVRLDLGHPGVRAFALTPDGKSVVWNENNAIVQARLSDGREQKRIALPDNSGVYRIRLSADGSRALLGGLISRVRLLDLAGGTILKNFSNDVDYEHVDMSSDGNRISLQSRGAIQVLTNPSPLSTLRQSLNSSDAATRRAAVQRVTACVKNPTRWIEAELRAAAPVAFPAKTRVPMQTAWDTGDAAKIARLIKKATSDERKDVTRAFAERFVDGLNDDVFSRREEVTKLLRDTREALDEASPAWDELRHQLFLAAETEGDLEATLRLTDPHYQLSLVAPSSMAGTEPSLFRHALLQIANRATRDAANRTLQRRLKAELYGE